MYMKVYERNGIVVCCAANCDQHEVFPLFHTLLPTNTILTFTYVFVSCHNVKPSFVKSCLVITKRNSC